MQLQCVGWIIHHGSGSQRSDGCSVGKSLFNENKSKSDGGHLHELGREPARPSLVAVVAMEGGARGLRFAFSVQIEQLGRSEREQPYVGVELDCVSKV